MAEQQPEAPVLPGVTRWRKRPVVVSAIQWTGSNLAEVQAFAGGGEFDAVGPEDRAEDPDMTAEVWDKLHSTWVHVYDGQWIIRGVKGELYPCAGDVFAATYEPAGNPLVMPQDEFELVKAPDGAGGGEGPWTESPGVALIAVERSRQVTAEGWTPEHDAHHVKGELARAAACYATPPDRRQIGTRLVDGSGDRGDRYARYPAGWPWHPDFWKPGDRIRELAKAGALIAAELDRLIAKGAASWP